MSGSRVAQLGEDGLDPETRDRYLKWLREQGIPQVPPPPLFRAAREELARLDDKIERARAGAKHAPDPSARRRIEAKIEHLETEADAIRQTLPEWQPLTLPEFFAGVRRFPTCRWCGAEVSREEAFLLGACPRCLANQPHLRHEGGAHTR